MSDEEIRVEIAYASDSDQALISLSVPMGTTVIEAILRSSITDEFPEVDFETAAKGIFSKIIKNDHVLADRDRVEIYRPLILDPMEARRQRAKKASKR
jgi:putative ubiquitin-RnfH superfamily antitoxin RatB of RatAB toxin-antitoxin module